MDEREASANCTEFKMRKTQQPRTMDAPMSEAVTRIVRIYKLKISFELNGFLLRLPKRVGVVYVEPGLILILHNGLWKICSEVRPT